MPHRNTGKLMRERTDILKIELSKHLNLEYEVEKDKKKESTAKERIEEGEREPDMFDPVGNKLKMISGKSRRNFPFSCLVQSNQLCVLVESV